MLKEDRSTANLFTKVAAEPKFTVMLGVYSALHYSVASKLPTVGWVVPSAIVVTGLLTGFLKRDSLLWLLKHITIFMVATLLFTTSLRWVDQSASGITVWGSCSSILAAGTQFLVAIAWGIGSCQLPAWLFFFSRLGSLGNSLKDVLFSLSAAYHSTLEAHLRAVANRDATKSWLRFDTASTLGRFISDKIDKLELRVIISLQASEHLNTRLQAMNRQPRSMAKNERLSLDAVYNLFGFTSLYSHVFGTHGLCPVWKQFISDSFVPSSVIIDIGAGDGRVSMELLCLGMRVVAVEENVNFIEKCKQLLEKNAWSSKLQLISGRFPIAKPEAPCDGAVLHQNVFIELINEYSSEEIWQTLGTIIRPGGKVLLDYMTNLKVPEPGESKILCENVRLADYCVSYGYKYIRNDGSSHTIQLNYRVIAADGSVLSHYPLLTFKIPELLDIIREAEIHGFVVQARSPTQQPTFFPGQLEIITLERT